MPALPDGLVATAPDSAGDIAAAWYAGPTGRYRHGVIGDAIEGSVLVVRTRDGATVSFRLPETEVFEDRYPRLADLDGDGRVEVIAMRSSIAAGASVTVYGLDNRALVERAASGFIGRANRWLNIAGIARFRGGRGLEIAVVRTPHIGGTLSFYAYRRGRLDVVGRLVGFSNHAIGSRELRLSAVADVNGDGRADLALPADDRRVLRIVGFVDGAFGEIGAAALPGRIDKAIGVTGEGPSLRFVVGLETGGVYAVHR